MFDEMLTGSGNRPEYDTVAAWIERHGANSLLSRNAEAEALFRQVGVTFAVYGEGGDPERLIPFDLIPRVFSAREWDIVERGSIQRAQALNAFLADVYGEQEIIKAGRIPAEVVHDNPAYNKALQGIRPPRDVYAHIVGVDLVRTSEDQFYVLEDNARTPSGISYVFETREVMLRMFPELFKGGAIRPVDNYPDMLLDAMIACAPPLCEGQPTCVLLSPGYFNSAYYEHSFLADRMGIELVEGQDLFVEKGLVYMRTVRGPERVDVIYKRIDDDFIDPLAFNPDSVLGVPGLMDVYRNGGVALVNAPGAGVADDKATYVFVPEMIRFYLGEEPIIDNVPTYRCSVPDNLKYVLSHLEELVVKEVHGSGGYGMLIGPASTAEERETFAAKLRENPSGFVAQPTLALSSVPALTPQGPDPRHVDLRPFVVTGAETKLIPGGLTRVAMRKGSLVVNSSQGGGVKDTWVLNHNPGEV